MGDHYNAFFPIIFLTKIENPNTWQKGLREMLKVLKRFILQLGAFTLVSPWH